MDITAVEVIEDHVVRLRFDGRLGAHHRPRAVPARSGVRAASGPTPTSSASVRVDP